MMDAVYVLALMAVQVFLFFVAAAVVYLLASLVHSWWRWKRHGPS